MHFLSGVVTFDICAVFETDKELEKTYGIYAKPIKKVADPFEDLINVLMGLTDRFEATEYCTTNYNNKDFKLIKYTENLWSQWDKREEQKELMWKT